MDFIELSKEDNKGIGEMSKMATTIVREYFDPLIGKEQNDYMIGLFQTEEAIKKQLESGYRYFFVKDKSAAVGFVAFYPRGKVMYLSKFYLYKTERGKGYANQMLDFIIDETRKAGLNGIELNVNKENAACRVYEHLGFKMIRSEKNDIGGGFYMDDYVYRFDMEERIMSDIMEFAHREEFRKWLSEHGQSHDGVWLLFGKAGGPKTIKAGEALEEALCFGWIDGQMQSIDDKTYKKYFSMRRKNSKWSEKNKALVKSLEERGLMTDAGRKKIEEARENGQWDAKKPGAVTEEQIGLLSAILEEYEPAHTNFREMSLSVKKTYTRAYFDAKTEAGRKSRIAWMVERLNQNLKPM